MILAWGALLGFISVAFGAFAEHGLHDCLSAEHFHFLMTGIRYNQVHAVVISAIGLAILNTDKLADIRVLIWSGRLFIIGTLLFSFSIYLSVSFDQPSLIKITPIGGITLLFAWLLLGCFGVLATTKR